MIVLNSYRKISLWKIVRGQKDDYTTGCLLDYNYFKDYHKMIVIDLNKHQAIGVDLKAIQQIDFTGNLENNATIFLFLKRQKKLSYIF